jgi:hypothetical protein
MSLRAGAKNLIETGTYRSRGPFHDGRETSGSEMYHPTIIERAFEVAQTSTTIDEIKHVLKSEGYSNVDSHLSGPSIRADLKKRFLRAQPQERTAE